MIAARLGACVDRIHQKSVDGYLITSRTDQFYLTGFDGEDGAALILPGKVYLLTDGRFQEEARQSAPWAAAVIRQGALSAALTPVMRRHRIRRLGFQPEALTVRQHHAFRQAIRPARLVAMPAMVEELRLIKDDTEVAAIEKAAHVAQTAMLATLKRIRPGMTERAVAAELEHEMLRRGASGPSFPTIVAEGPQAALPHAVPGDRRIRVGSAILIDWGATVGHYRSDLTRMVFIRRIPPRFRRMYEAVLSAQREGIAAVAPGVPCRDVDAKARRRLKQLGMAGQFTHGLGHGLGLEVHEAPRLSSTAPGAEQPLRPGMVVTVEPGVYFPGVGGVRIEDDVLVTAHGCRLLSSLPRELDAWVI